jgi:hypothetical protein
LFNKIDLKNTPEYYSKMVTLRQFINYYLNFEGKNIDVNIMNIINSMREKLEKNQFYLGGQLKMTYDDEISLDTFEKVRQIDKQREIEYGVYNSFELISVNNHKKLLDDTEKIFTSYLHKL